MRSTSAGRNGDQLGKNAFNPSRQRRSVPTNPRLSRPLRLDFRSPFIERRGNVTSISNVPDTHTLCRSEMPRNAGSKLAPISQAADRKFVLIPWPVDIPLGKLWTGSSQASEWSNGQTPSSQPFRRFQPHDTVSMFNCVRQQARSTFQNPGVTLNNL
jgi:hypothetical protein